MPVGKDESRILCGILFRLWIVKLSHCYVYEHFESNFKFGLRYLYRGVARNPASIHDK